MLIPFGLLWVLVTGFVVVLPDRYAARSSSRVAAVVSGSLVLAWLIAPVVRKPTPNARHEGGDA